MRPSLCTRSPCAQTSCQRSNISMKKRRPPETVSPVRVCIHFELEYILGLNHPKEMASNFVVLLYQSYDPLVNPAFPITSIMMTFSLFYRFKSKNLVIIYLNGLYFSPNESRNVFLASWATLSMCICIICEVKYMLRLMSLVGIIGGWCATDY